MTCSIYDSLLLIMPWIDALQRVMTPSVSLPSQRSLPVPTGSELWKQRSMPPSVGMGHPYGSSPDSLEPSVRIAELYTGVQNLVCASISFKPTCSAFHGEVTSMACRQARRLAAEAMRVAGNKMARVAIGSGAALVGAARHVLPHRKVLSTPPGR